MQINDVLPIIVKYVIAGLINFVFSYIHIHINKGRLKKIDGLNLDDLLIYPHKHVETFISFAAGAIFGWPVNIIVSLYVMIFDLNRISFRTALAGIDNMLIIAIVWTR